MLKNFPYFTSACGAGSLSLVLPKGYRLEAVPLLELLIALDATSCWLDLTHCREIPVGFCLCEGRQRLSQLYLPAPWAQHGLGRLEQPLPGAAAGTQSHQGLAELWVLRVPGLDCWQCWWARVGTRGR